MPHRETNCVLPTALNAMASSGRTAGSWLSAAKHLGAPIWVLCHAIKWLAKFSSYSRKDLVLSKSLRCRDRRMFALFKNVIFYLTIMDKNLCTQENKVSLFRTSGAPYSPHTHSQMKHIQPDERRCLLALKCWILLHVRMLASVS